MSHQAHHSDPQVLNQRTLERDHRHLAEIITPGLSILDVGCGTGAITAGIARAVGPTGFVVGADRDMDLLDIATAAYADIPNLRFEYAEAATLPFRGRFDIVTAARTLQWIDDPKRALVRMRDAARPGGTIVVLDYNHSANGWRPEPPREFRQFYEAFLHWREAYGWDNSLADYLPVLFAGAGLVNISSRPQDEITVRGEPDFDGRTAIWKQVIDTIGPRIVTDELINDSQLAAASAVYREWAKTSLAVQTLRLCSVTGTVPS